MAMPNRWHPALRDPSGERPMLGVTSRRREFKNPDQMTHLSSQLCPRAFRAGMDRSLQSRARQALPSPGAGGRESRWRGRHVGPPHPSAPAAARYPAPRTQARLFSQQLVSFGFPWASVLRGSEGSLTHKSPCKGNPCVPVTVFVLTSLS